MSTRFWRQGVPIAALALGVALGGCRARSEGARTDETATGGTGTAVDTGVRATDTAARSPANELSDANIVALLDEANKADSAAGALAIGKVASAGVKKFAREMMADH